MQCPTHEDFAALLEGHLAIASQALIEAHLAECTVCDEAWGLLVRESMKSDPLAPRSPPLKPTMSDPSLPAPSASKGELRAGTYVGRYLVIDVIGVGGMGSVYRAYDAKLNRNVAVKLIHVEPRLVGEASSRSRLLREAQALAQMDHPHIVSVFDVGEFREQVFFAMELIEGSSFRDVLRRREHDRRSLLRLLEQAGCGLAAAHAAGLVHRDFKPENVLIDANQHAKVVDFGLARAVETYEAEDLVTVSPEASISLLERRITETGVRIGTPAYMAPEQYLGSRIDARADQFSFSIVAYEALFGRHPFSHDNGRLSMVALCAGKISVPSRPLDRGYLRVLARGLSSDPAGRYPSLQCLLDELVQVPRRRRRRGVAIAVVVCAAAGLIGGPAIQEHRAQRCDAAATQALAGIWDPPRRMQVESAFAGDGKVFGRDIWNRVAATLDGYADQWKRTSIDLCRNVEWWRAEENAIQRRSYSCLDERRRELRAVTDVFSGGDPNVRLYAPDALIQLGSLSTCTNSAALALTPLRAHDIGTSSTVERIRDLLAKSRALRDAHEVAAAKEAARQALELARTQQDRGLIAEAHYRLGVAQVFASEYAASESSLVQALADAEASGHERLLPLVWIELLTVIVGGSQTERFSDIECLVPFIEATVERFDPHGPASIRLSYALGLLDEHRGKDDLAIARFNAALNMARTAYGENDMRRLEIYDVLVNSERNVNQLDKGIAHARLALAEAEALFGKDHPQLIKMLSRLARMLTRQGDAADAQTVRERALRMVEQLSPSEIPAIDLGLSLFELGYAYLEDDQPAAALSIFRRSLDIHKANKEEWAEAGTIAAIARAEAALGQLDVARTMFEEALARFTGLLGAGHPESIKAGVKLGHTLLTLRRGRDALQLCTQLLDAGTRALGPHHVLVAWELSCVGEASEQLGRLPEALAALERAEKLLEEGTTKPWPEYRAGIRFALARVLWRTGGDRARARRLADEALNLYQHGPRAFAKDGVAVQTWLSKISARQR
ncbi:protein kinase domain-containing protein [Pendulispora albinea]|uniref:Serine/threonine-protein kinase n=1 Tax=Pendulispora albinea TaxID=2741071 RepID=A0ABZ2M913_9BACT